MKSSTLNKVYNELKTLTIKQLEYARDIKAYGMFYAAGPECELFRHQCNVTIEKKMNRKW